MAKQTVWTKQSDKILETLEKHGRHIVKEEYIKEKMEDHSKLYLDSYAWFRERAALHVKRPEDALFPVWVSLNQEEAIGHTRGDGTVLLEIEMEEEDVLEFDLEKWGCVVNYRYIPNSAEDADEHAKLLEKNGIDDDTTAYMTPFYPIIKRKIISSWDRLFDDEIILSTEKVGTIWEVKQEWIKKIS